MFEVLVLNELNHIPHETFINKSKKKNSFLLSTQDPKIFPKTLWEILVPCFTCDEMLSLSFLIWEMGTTIRCSSRVCQCNNVSSTWHTVVSLCGSYCSCCCYKELWIQIQLTPWRRKKYSDKDSGQRQILWDCSLQLGSTRPASSKFPKATIITRICCLPVELHRHSHQTSKASGHDFIIKPSWERFPLASSLFCSWIINIQVFTQLSSSQWALCNLLYLKEKLTPHLLPIFHTILVFPFFVAFITF